MINGRNFIKKIEAGVNAPDVTVKAVTDIDIAKLT